jgi:uncharacterized membrane protein (UPF0136 family)
MADEMLLFPSIVILAYAAVLILGGIIGWQMSGSRISLTASLVSAALLSVAYRLSYTYPTRGWAMGAVIAAALAILFTIRWRKTRKLMPAGIMLLISGAAAAVLAWSAWRLW